MSGNRIFIIYYDGQPFDHVQNAGRGYGRAKSPKRIYWTRGHASNALRGIIAVQRQAQERGYRRYGKNEPVFDPSLFEIREFELTPVAKEDDSNA